MFKKLLIMSGLRKAPPPVRPYLAATSIFGVVPVAVFAAWKNRDRIASLYRRVTHRQGIGATA